MLFFHFDFSFFLFKYSFCFSGISDLFTYKTDKKPE